MSDQLMPDSQPRGTTSYSSKQIARVRDLLTRLSGLRRTVRFYPMDHPAMTDGVRELMKTVSSFHEEGVDVELVFFEGELVFGDKLLAQESILFDQLIRDMAAIGAGSLTILRGITPSELGRAVSVLAMDAQEVQSSGGLVRIVEEVTLPHVIVSEVKVFEKPDMPEDAEGAAKQSYDGAIDLLRELDALIRRNEVVQAGHVKSVVRSLVDNVVANRYAMLELTGLRDYDEYTFFHSANVAILSLALASSITSEYRFLSSLGVGALLHDIGKMTVDVQILNKPGALSAEEWALVREHPVYGAEQAALIPGLDQSALVIILEHHMRYDGSGYPQRVPKRPQHLASRIVAIADAFDAMTSRRAYSAARVQDEAMSLIAQSAGSALDPMLCRLFISMMGVYPPRSVVELTDKRTGIVLRPSDNDPLRPVVRVLADENGTMIDPQDVDLDAMGIGVNRCINPRSINIQVEDYL